MGRQSMNTEEPLVQEGEVIMLRKERLALERDTPEETGSMEAITEQAMAEQASIIMRSALIRPKRLEH